MEDRYGKRHPRITTQGWDLQVEWRDGSTTWVPLSELKESNPIEVAEYTVANKIAKEPAFAWWVRKALRKRDWIIKKVRPDTGLRRTSSELNYQRRWRKP